MRIKEIFFSFKDKQVWKDLPVLLKVLIGVTCVSLFLNFWFATTLLSTSPRVQTEAQVLLEDAISSEKRMEAEPFSTDISSRSELEEALVLFYLKSRYRLFADIAEMRRQFFPGGILYRLSSSSVYRRIPFPPKFDETISRLSYTQTIDVKNIIRNKNTWIIDFDVVRLNSDLSSIRIPKNAVISISFSKRKKFFSRYFSNPYGQYVISYQESNRVR